MTETEAYAAGRRRGLDARRAVQLVTTRRSGPGRRGSGYLMSEGIVLTAAHVVRDAASATVRFITDKGEASDAAATIIWLDSGIDVALLRVSAESTFAVLATGRVPRPVFARVSGVAECEALGFPASR